MISRREAVWSLLAAAGCRPLRAEVNPAWTEPFPAFKIAPNVYYVGSKSLASYLITTPRGHILINSSLVESVPLIEQSMKQVGFQLSDVRILLISHAHWDHCAGSAAIKEKTHAAYVVMDADVASIESGGRTDFHYGADKSAWYPPAKVDRVLHDGSKVALGAQVLTAHLTPGHTRGCTTWTMTVSEGGKTRNVVIVGSPNVNTGYKLVGNKKYPRIAEDYERGFRTLESLPCDYFLGAHGEYFGLTEKYSKMRAGDASALIDPDGYKAYVADRKQAFQAELDKQLAASKT